MTTLDELQATAAERWQVWLEQHPDIRPELHLVNDVLGERYHVALSETIDALIPEDRDSLYRLAGDPRVWDFDSESAPETVAQAAYMAVRDLLARHVLGEEEPPEPQQTAL